MNETAKKYAKILNKNLHRRDFDIHILPEGKKAMERHLFKLKSILGERDRRVQICKKAFAIAEEAMTLGIRFLPAVKGKSHCDLFTAENGDIRLPF